jgi:hypothetical protein
MLHFLCGQKMKVGNFEVTKMLCVQEKVIIFIFKERQGSKDYNKKKKRW